MPRLGTALPGALLLGCLWLPAARSAEPPSVLVTAHHQDDIVGVSAEGNRLVIEVTSSAGIGSATIRLLSGEWPGAVMLRFLGLAELEGFRAAGAGRAFRCDLLRLEGIAPRHACLLDGRADGAVTRTPATHQVSLPSALLPADRSEIRIEWVDYWR